MSKINVLSSKIYNRISAGEVVERPASVIKELVENSIDAKADRITIEIISGGISSIKITDNGVGIEKSELKKAIMPHATSKISTLSDLDCIETLGFRGEALASIASVSKLSIISKPKSQENGAKIITCGGEIEQIIDFPFVDGTEIEVNNLFFNTPAREKFLKKPKSEESEITAIVIRLILSNPNVSFLYIVDGKKILQSFGDGLESSMLSVYGDKVSKDCFYIDTFRNGLKITGYIGKHHFTKSNRNYQSLFINGRYVINQTIASAIHNAYSTYLMKRQYPFYVLNVTLANELVDVNVHPNKTDVRFANNEIIYGTFYSVVSKVLDGSSEALNIVSPNFIAQKENIEIKSEKPIDYVTHNKQTAFKLEKLVFNDSSLDINKGKNQTNNEVDVFAENKAYLESLEKKRVESIQTEKSYKNVQTITNQQVIEVERQLRCVGQVLNTYLIFDDGNDVFIIDQHAAHERILFDKFTAQINDSNIDVQPLLLPYVFDVDTFEYDFLSEKLNVLKEIGIEIEEFGNRTFKVSSIPVSLTNISLKDFFDTVLFELTELRKISLDSVLKENIAQKACKSAIKAGDTLSNADIEALTKQLNSNLGLKCPHGRPIAIKITKTEIEKWFKRIV